MDASVDAVAQTITVPVSGNTRFYRIRSDTALTITSVRVSGGNAVLKYH